MNAAIGNDFHVLVGKQHVDQDAAVVLGIPDAQPGECLEGACARRLMLQNQRQRQRCFDGEANLTDMSSFAVGDRALYPIQRGRRKNAPRRTVIGEQMPPETPGTLCECAHRGSLVPAAGGAAAAEAATAPAETSAAAEASATESAAAARYENARAAAAREAGE